MRLAGCNVMMGGFSKVITVVTLLLLGCRSSRGDRTLTVLVSTPVAVADPETLTTRPVPGARLPKEHVITLPRRVQLPELLETVSPRSPCGSVFVSRVSVAMAGPRFVTV